MLLRLSSDNPWVVQRPIAQSAQQGAVKPPLPREHQGVVRQPIPRPPPKNAITLELSSPVWRHRFLARHKHEEMSVRTALRPPPWNPKRLSSPLEVRSPTPSGTSGPLEERSFTPTGTSGPLEERSLTLTGTRSLFITLAQCNSEADTKAVNYAHIYASSGLIQRVEAWLETIDLQ
ncbi:hypothetical protein M441DRAFT_22575 [Trichoderma asperellum CBS 433.97]|uniref:Uncharacterized protein n=1 Tax=Trichoderma asperellum (strain ATCC 204424 / CBS 433.97 / NBRC 101777) TaxID=1042311 RepID=A0A2T3ZP38_TRIA4|nr:hypothetical protein M441DRAFT_22575 [Trichoderma asperellum CBS 433.97]PTB46573.1 hypothetical protein M441DRAFT_22575 [Trichoderma asperellum CBS 433.97]